MDIHIRTKSDFMVPITMEHLAALKILSEHHYDHRCKEASRSSGFLSTWQKIVKYTPPSETPSVRAEFSELDICLKILELTHAAAQSGMLDDDAVKLCHGLTRDFSGALTLANSKFTEWQTIYKSTETA